MKRIFFVGVLLAISGFANAQDITWADKTTGGTFSATDANEVKTAVNSKLDESAVDTDLSTVSASDDTWPSAKATKALFNTISGTGADGTYGISLMNNSATFAPVAGYDAGFAVIGNQPYAYLSGANVRLAPNLLTGYTSGAGTVAGTDSVLEAIQKLNGNDAALRAKYVSGTEADFYGTLLDPQAIYAVDGTNHAVTLITNTPAAFTITAIRVTCDADPTTEITLTFQHKAAGVGYGSPTTIEAVQTTAGVANITSGIDDATIPANTKVFATLSDPDDALNECAWQIEGDWD